MEKKINKNINNGSARDFLLYKTAEGKVKVEIFLHNKNIWLSQENIATLFDVQRPAITKHLKNIFESNELVEKMVCSVLEHTTVHGAIEGKTQTQSVKFYNLDAVIAVGYRVNSKKATQFRIWATERLKEYIIKGFTMDDERLKTPNYMFGQDYFEEQLERIKVIRSSERRFYQKITDIYVECSADYDKNSIDAKNFFATVQNKLHFAITHQKTDIGIAKNYLNKDELDKLNEIVEMYLIFATSQAKNRKAMYMQDWEKKLSEFLKLNDKNNISDFDDYIKKLEHDK